MERIAEEETACDEEEDVDRSDDEGVEVTSVNKLNTTSIGGQPQYSTGILPLLWEKPAFKLSGVMSAAGGDEEPDMDTLSVCSSLMDTCGLSISSLPSLNPSTHHHSHVASSSSSALCLTPPLPPSVELSSVLTDVRLTLDVYQGGAAALPLLWGAIPGQLRGLQYLRLGSEDKPGLDGALEVVPHLTELRSLAIRGTWLDLCM